MSPGTCHCPPGVEVVTDVLNGKKVVFMGNSVGRFNKQDLMQMVKKLGGEYRPNPIPGGCTAALWVCSSGITSKHFVLGFKDRNQWFQGCVELLS